MVTTRRQQQQDLGGSGSDGGGGGGEGAAAAARPPRATPPPHGAATLTPEQHRARLDEYRAAWAPPKTLAGRLHAWVHENVVYASALIGVTMLDVGERAVYLSAVALVLALVAAGGWRQGSRVAGALRAALMSWAATQQQQQQQQQADALGVDAPSLQSQQQDWGEEDGPAAAA